MRKLVIPFPLFGPLFAAVLILVSPDLAAASTSSGDRVSPADFGRVVKATGVVKPCVGAEVRVGSRASGVVQRLYVKVGDKVQKSQLLAELDDRELLARRDQGQAELRRAQAELRYAQNELCRKRELALAKVATPSELDLAERNQAVAEQQVAATEAALASVATQLDYARIVAPISGVVASVSTQEGETVSATLESPTFVTLIDLERLEVRAYVDETDIGRVQPGQEVRFTVDTYGDEEFEGVVATIYPKAEIRDNVVDYVTVVQFHPPRDRILRPEMTAAVRIGLDPRQKAMAIPQRALRSGSAQTHVPARREGALERRSVALGARVQGWGGSAGESAHGDEVVSPEENFQGEQKP